MTLRVLVYQHMPRDTPGLLGEALERRGAMLDVCCPYVGEPLRDPAGYDALLILGGEMNVYQEEQYPWLAPETQYIRQSALADQPSLGICLGAQLQARALGAIVRLGGAPEIGLAQIELNEAGGADPLFAGLPTLEAMEWHDDTFDVPAGAVALASSAGCENQAFRYGRRAYGLQFHPEVTPALLEEWIAAAPYLAVDDQRALRAHFASRYAGLQSQADGLIENFLRLSFR